jgi:serine/threonine protein kinase
MIHRDLKPANMMLTPAPGRHETTWDSTIKILDIGLGREMFDDATPEGQIETQLTVEGSVLGTPDYLAPEQAKDARSADIRADIYSIGCVLFHCLCGHPPFPETNIMSQMLKHATERPPLLSSIVPDIPPALQSVLDAMLAKFPDDRYATPAAAAEALTPFLGSGGIAPTAATMVPAFKEWLETESHLEMPKILPQPPVAPTKTGQFVSVSGSGKPGTGAHPTVAMPPPPKETLASRTAPTKALPTVPARPVPVTPLRSPIPRRPVEMEEVDVELVTDLTPGPMPAAVQPEIQIVKVKEVRPLWEFDRRDWIMLAAGAAGVLAAVGVGYGLARLARKKPEESTGEE